MLDERKVRIYAWMVRHGIKALDDIPEEYKQAVQEHNDNMV